jgi:hypothetical protein
MSQMKVGHPSNAVAFRQRYWHEEFTTPIIIRGAAAHIVHALVVDIARMQRFQLVRPDGDRVSLSLVWRKKARGEDQ